MLWGLMRRAFTLLFIQECNVSKPWSHIRSFSIPLVSYKYFQRLVNVHLEPWNKWAWKQICDQIHSSYLCIFRVNILFKQFRSFVDWIVCQVDEHVVDISIRGGVKFCCKPEGTRSLGNIQPYSIPGLQGILFGTFTLWGPHHKGRPWVDQRLLQEHTLGGRTWFPLSATGPWCTSAHIETFLSLGYSWCHW